MTRSNGQPIGSAISRLLCWLGWHAENGTHYANGINLMSACKRCNVRICRDSQGNWFEIGGER